MTGEDCIAALKALGEESRMRMFRLLFNQRMSVSTISEQLNLPQYNVSKHLRVMRESGLLEIEKRGQHRFYKVSEKFKAQLGPNPTADLGCCTFRLDKLPQ